MLWIIVGIIVYLLIGAGLLLYVVLKDPWGGLVLEIWYIFIPLWIIFVAFSLWQNMK